MRSALVGERSFGLKRCFCLPLLRTFRSHRGAWQNPLVPLVELLMAPILLIWGGVLWTWFQAKSAWVKFWTAAGATILTFAPVVVYAVLDESARAVVRGVLD